MLLKSGADPNITEENGETALHIACRYGNLKLVMLLLVDGASPTFQSNVQSRFFLFFYC
jgi:ankyrin repeat protein